MVCIFQDYPVALPCLYPHLILPGDPCPGFPVGQGVHIFLGASGDRYGKRWAWWRTAEGGTTSASGYDNEDDRESGRDCRRAKREKHGHFLTLEERTRCDQFGTALARIIHEHGEQNGREHG